MKAWFYSLTPREQMYLLAMSLVLSIWFVFQMMLVPADARRQQLEANNEAAAELLARVDAKVTQLVRVRSQGGTDGTSDIATAISRSTELAGLSVRRLQPNSRGEVQVRFESVDYDALASWLYQVEAVENFVIIDASLTQAGRSGGVNASLRIARID